MICKKCGFENSDESQFCQKCGKSLLPRKRKKTALIVGCAAGGAILIAAALLLVLLPRGSKVAGAWHNKELEQVLRFHDDNTVVIRTSAGDFEAEYLLDKGGDKGVITLNGTAITFTVGDDDLLLTSNGVGTHFSPGDMEITAATAVLSANTPSPAPTAAPSEAAAAGNADTPEPTPTPTHTPTAAPADTPEPAEDTPEPAEDTPEPGDTEIDPGMLPGLGDGILRGDVLGGLFLQSVVGEWRNSENSTYVLTFDADGGYEATTLLGLHFTGTYTFGSTTGEGVITHSGGSTTNFTVDGDTMTWEDGSVFLRE